MPELPEVQTIVSHINTELAGARLVASSKPEFVNLRNAALLTALRVGKNIMLKFGETAYIQIHLGLSGDVFISKVPVSGAKLVLGFDNGKYLSGVTMLYGKAYYASQLPQLGVDPTVSAQATEDALRAAGPVRIKDALLDQHIVSGVGNIYATEALYTARQNPFALTGRCDLKRLSMVLRDILCNAVKFEECSSEDYNLGEGMRLHRMYHHIYGKAGEPCPTCGQTIACEELSGRKTYYCPSCQGVTF